MPNTKTFFLTPNFSVRYNLPKIIWMYWHQGWDNAPNLIRQCLFSWLHHNPEWEFMNLDNCSLTKYIEVPQSLRSLKDIPLAALSDIIRILLLEKYGGIWIDATVFCNKPLDRWVFTAANSGFFAFQKPASGRPVASWFLSAHQNNYLVNRWKQLTIQFWEDGDFVSQTRHLWPEWKPALGNDIYFWFHKLFAKLLCEDRAFESLFKLIPYISANGPHIIQRNGLLNPPSEDLKVRIMTRVDPLYKLSYRLPKGLSLKNSAIEFLFNTV